MLALVIKIGSIKLPLCNGHAISCFNVYNCGADGKLNDQYLQNMERVGFDRVFNPKAA